jgi:hypothetical protein
MVLKIENYFKSGKIYKSGIEPDTLQLRPFYFTSALSELYDNI